MFHKYLNKNIYQYIKDCEEGAGRTPSVRRRKYRKYTLSEQILADLPDSLKIRQNPAKLN